MLCCVVHFAFICRYAPKKPRKVKHLTNRISFILIFGEKFTFYVYSTTQREIFEFYLIEFHLTCRILFLVILFQNYKDSILRIQLGKTLIKNKLIQWRIQDFPEVGTPTLQGAPTYNLAKFSQKLHEIDRIWTRGNASLAPPLDQPLAFQPDSPNFRKL